MKQGRLLLSSIDCRVLRDLPDQPGVYMMLGCDGRALYVGKARSLRQRVRSYFSNQNRHLTRTYRMLEQAKRIEFIAANSLLEAAVRESDEIKQRSPKYNIALRENNRKVWFYTKKRELSDSNSGSQPGEHLISRPDLVIFLRIMETARSSRDEVDVKDIEFIARYLPSDIKETSVVRQGLTRLLKKYDEYFVRMPASQALEQVGKKLWLDRASEPVEEKESSEEVIVRRLEGLVSLYAWESRRIRWYTLLCESVIAWTEPIRRKCRRVYAVIERGELKCCEALSADDKIPVPQGSAGRFNERQKCFNLATLDRMKVITGEIKRIVRNKRWITVRFSPDVDWDRERIIKMLRWL